MDYRELTRHDIEEVGWDNKRNYFTFRYGDKEVDIPRSETFPVLFETYTRDVLRTKARREGVKFGDSSNKAGIAEALAMYYIITGFERAEDHGSPCGGRHMMYGPIMCPRCGS